MGGMHPPFRTLSLALCLLALGCARAPQPAPVSAPGTARDGHAAHETSTATAAASAPVHAADADTPGAFGQGTPVTVTLHVHDQAGAAMDAERFQTVHEQKLHVLIVDPSLGDYSHVHPQALGHGDWRFVFTPRYDRPYRLWLDATPVGGKQGYAIVTVNENAANVPVEAVVASNARAQDVEATLSFAQPPVAGAMTEGRIELRRNGRPLTALEPVMGTYGHIVGIAQDWREVAHVHPLGAGPHAPGDRGGPVLRFHLEPEAAGFLKLYAQVRVDGRDLYLPFGIEVGAAK
jgi:hypothetical protein